MKKNKISVLLMAVAVVMTGTLSSCNKKLKEEMKDLESSVNEQKAKNDALQTQVNTLNSGLLRAPLKVNFTTTTTTDETVAFSKDLSLIYGAEHSYSYISDNGNSTYNVYIYRGGDLSGDFSSEISFTYTPATSTASNITVEVSGYSATGTYIDEAYFYQTTGNTQTLAVSAFDYAAGTISFSYSGNTTSAYGSNYYYQEPMTLTVTYSGAMAKYPYSAVI